MYIVLTGGAGNITKPLALQLLEEGHAVIVVSRSAENIAELTEAGALPAIGSIEDVDFLTETFTRADAVYTMVPPNWGAADWKGWIGKIGENYAAALKTAKIKHVVNLSSIGAHMPDGAGPVSGLYRVEQALNQLDEEVTIVHLRPGYFYENLLANIDMVKHMNFIGANYGGEGFTFPVAAPADIAAVVAEELVNYNENSIRKIRYITSDEVTTPKIAAALGSAIGKPDLQWVVFSDEQQLQGVLQAGFPQEVATNYTEMGHAMQSGTMAADYWQHKPETFGKVTLHDFAETFAAAYKAKS